MKHIFAIILMALSFPAQAEKNQDETAAWVQNAAEEIMTFHFGNFDKRMEENKQYFTKEGHEKFLRAMKNARYKESVEQNKLLVTAKATCFPEKQKPQGFSGALKSETIYKVPLNVLFNAGTKVKNDYYKIEMILKEDQSAKAMKIEQSIAVPITKEEAQICKESDRKKAEIQKLRKGIELRQIKIKELEESLGDDE